MSIIPVSANSNIILSTMSNNNVIKLLEKQKMQLQEQIQKTNESKLDEKTKQDRVKQLQDQIQQIDMEILQKQTERLNQNQNQNQRTSQPSNQQTANSKSNGTDSEYSSNLAGMSSLIQASSTYSQAKIMNSTKNSLNNKSRILKKEIEFDESRSLSGSKAILKRQELQEIESREQMLDKKMAETNQTAKNQVKEASRSVSENDNDGASNEDKNEANRDITNTTINNNPKTQDTISLGNIQEKNSQQQGLKGTGQIYKRVDIKV